MQSCSPSALNTISQQDPARMLTGNPSLAMQFGAVFGLGLATTTTDCPWLVMITLRARLQLLPQSPPFWSSLCVDYLWLFSFMLRILPGKDLFPPVLTDAGVARCGSSGYVSVNGVHFREREIWVQGREGLKVNAPFNLLRKWLFTVLDFSISEKTYPPTQQQNMHRKQGLPEWCVCACTEIWVPNGTVVTGVLLYGLY